MNIAKERYDNVHEYHIIDIMKNLLGDKNHI